MGFTYNRALAVSGNSTIIAGEVGGVAAFEIFNFNGTLNTDIGNAGLVLNNALLGVGGVAIQHLNGQDEIIIAGNVTGWGKTYTARYYLDGSIDSSYGINGVSEVGSTTGGIAGVAINPYNNYVIKYSFSGFFNGTADFTVLSADGSSQIANTISITGWYTDLQAGGITFNSKGDMILVSGSGQMAVYSADLLKLDITFSYPFSPTYTGGEIISNSICIDSDDNILEGVSYVNNSSDAILVRYKGDGSLDSTFGTNGVVTLTYQGSLPNYTDGVHHNGIGIDSVHTQLVGGEEKILVTGNVDGHMFIQRFNQDGSLDSQFNSNIVVTDALNPSYLGDAYNGHFRWYLSEILANGNIVVSGHPEGQDSLVSVVIYTPDGNLLATNYTGDDSSNNILGTNVSDAMNGQGGNDNLNGGDGNDVLMGGTGNDTIAGGAGVDTADFSDSSAGVVVNLTAGTATGDGTDTLTGVENAVGGSGNDTLTANNTTGSELDGGAGNDELIGGAGNDTLNGGDGFDCAEYVATTSGVNVNLQTGVASGSEIGSDTLALIEAACGGSGNDTLTAANTGSTLEGGAGNDTIIGGTGADILMGGTGNDTIAGGAGVDTADFSDSSAGVVVNLTAGTATGDGTDTLTGVENAVGGSGNDTLTANNTTGSELDGGAGSDTLNGGAVADVLYGGDGNDIVNAGAGNDLIIGGDGAGNDTYNGGDGVDTVKYTSALASITVDLSTSTGTATSTAGSDASHIGNDTLTGIENIIAGNYNDILTGSSLDNAITGESGNDTINGGTGNDTAIYQGTKSQYTITNNNNGTWTVADTVDGRDGIDTISNIEYLQFTDQTFTLTVAPPQTLTGTSKADTLTGGAGNDILIGLAGTDTLNGQDGSDLYVMTSTSDHKAAEIIDTGTSGSDEVRFTTLTSSTLTLYALDRGIDSVTIGTGTAASAVTTGTTANNINAALVANALSIIGNDGNNTLTGTAYEDTLTGNAGNDTLNGGAGADNMIGGTGNDTYVLDNAGDEITENANEGSDLVQVAITTAAGTYTLGSNLENATLTNTVAYNLTGNSLNNTLTGNAANNTLDGSAGTDTLVGGAGNDTYLVDIITATGALEDTLTEASNAGTDTIQLRGTYSGALANLTLATNFENLDISATASSLYNLTGNTGNNVLTGNDANNTLSGGTGADALIGGLGNDTYVVDNVSDTVTEYADQGTDTIQSSVTFSLANFIESLTLTGTSAINGTGNTLDNTLTGNSGVNTLNGGDGNDSLSGLAGNDVLNGGGGNDILSGGAGSDNLTGGLGADHFVFDTALNATTNKDTITDFTHGTDKIDLQNLVMTALGGTEGALSTNQFWSGAGVVKGHDTDDRVVYNTTTGALYYDADGSGSGAAVQFAILGTTTHPTDITYQDFLIV